ncbi:amidohydrolase family protein [Antarcticibacterium flavum]|uniref:Amidohydrolase family protein n=1 Tax=Antarcticibacterium flavum TaxID=2058175 RepID=A0A5B7X1R6_9FLAO|nr:MULTISPECIES: amidohydrolase family protein [Antarcticibacterium]MCM4158718.1 N-acyl-D-amino acid deacylase [Antarcticibacterium sp. W02-3]QCY68571.1 amidohydrolase family protein [Antarcticibacterium flavum]
MRFLTVIIFLFFTLQTYAQEDGVENYDLLIKNATVIDGTGAGAYNGYLGIKDGEIISIGDKIPHHYKTKQEIDATGFTVTPGFIDSHSHGDPLETPEFKNFLAMGVTTITLGQDGHSPAEADLSSWMQKVNDKKPAVNIAMFVGHNTLRTLAGVNFDSIPSNEGLNTMQRLLKNGFSAGAFGMSTGLEYTPGNFSRQEELNALAKTVGEEQGIIMSHMRNEDDKELENALEELLIQGRYAPVHVSHIKVVYGKGRNRALEIIKILDSARNAGIKVTGDLYPYTASHTGIAILFPAWAKKPNNYPEIVSGRRVELEDFLRKKVAQRNGPEAILLGSGSFKGKTLADVSQQLKKPFEQVLIDEIGPYGAGAAHFIMEEELQTTFLLDDQICISSDGSPTMYHPRGYGSFSKVIQKYVLQEKILDLEEAVYKMTGLPAQILQLKDRSLLKKGYKADVLIFKPEEIKAHATYEKPHQLAEGMKFIIVNGRLVMENGNFTKIRNGKVLSR